MKKNIVCGVSALGLAVSFVVIDTIVYRLNPISHEKEITIKSSTEPNFIHSLSDTGLKPEINQCTDLVLSEPDVNFKKSAITQLSTSPKKSGIEIPKGAGLHKFLGGLGISGSDVQKIGIVFKRFASDRSLRAGQKVEVSYTDSTKTTLESIIFPLIGGEKVTITREDSNYRGECAKLKFIKTQQCVEGTIKSNFYQAALRAGAPRSAIREAIRVLGYSVNFQHDVEEGSPFQIMYEISQTEDGKHIQPDSLQLNYISIKSKTKKCKIYSYTDSLGRGYYNEKGVSVVQSLLQTPLDSNRIKISSGFSHARYHPILKYCRAHNGVDFRASTGTRIRAAGDGSIMKKGYWGGYGNCIQIRHSSGYTTLYAHLSQFAPSVRVGGRVKQGEWIGNVGSTGTSSGPHLHYGVTKNGVFVDPQKVKMMPSTHLSGGRLKKFNTHKTQIEEKLMNNLKSTPISLYE